MMIGNKIRCRQLLKVCWLSVFVLCLNISGVFAQDHQGLLVDLSGQMVSSGMHERNTSSHKLMKIVQLKEGRQTLKEVLHDIAEQAGLKLSYSKQLIPLTKTVHVKQAKVTTEQALWSVLKGTPLRFGISATGQLFFFEVPKGKMAKQQETIIGTVTDAGTGETLPGVNVLVKGTTIGTATDANGAYELTVESLQDTLVFSFIGYQTQELPINGRTTIDVALQTQAVAGEELIVVGYGTVTKRDLTGSVAQISAEEISETPVVGLDQALQGKASGVKVTSISGEPGSGTTIRIRGGNSISASNEPLYVIDGFIGGGNLNTINPNDIASIEILKDASATAIYGSRGANGVVLITTKRGQSGDTQVSIRSFIGWQQLANKIDFLTGPELAAYQNEAAEFIGRDIPFSDLNEVEHYDWIDALTRTAPMKDLTFTVSGGTDNTRYYISGNAMDQKGIIRNSGFTRYQSRLNLDNQLKEWLDVNVQMNISRTNRKNNTVGMNQLMVDAQTFIPFYREDGSYTTINPASDFPFNNPIAQADLEKNTTFQTRLQGNAEFIIQPLENLEIISRLGSDLNSVKQNIFLPKGLPLRLVRGQKAFGSVRNAESWNILSENTIDYEYHLNESNRFNILGGFTYQRFENASTFASADGIPSDALRFNSLEIGDPENRDVNTGFTDWTMLSYLGRLHYTFKDKYLFTLTSRLDGSSRLAERNKWAFFPSGAVAWQLGREPFMEKIDAVEDLKLRVSFGQIGNQAIGVYESLASLNQTTTFFGETEHVAFRQGNVANPNLKWETTRQFDVGVDADLFENRLSFTLDYYYKRTKNLLLSREIPFQTGFQTRLENIGEVENQGLEFSVDASLFRSQDFSWNIDFNISGNRNKVLDLGEKDFIDLETGARLVEGEVGASFVGLVYEGTWTQEEIDENPGFMAGLEPGLPRFRDVNGNGTFDGEGDFTILGNHQPDFFGGFSSSFQYKNWRLDTDFQYSYGNEIFNIEAGQYFFGRYEANMHAMARDRWTTENQDSDIPRAGSEIIADYRFPISATVQDGSFLRLKNLRLEYAIPVNKLGGLGSNYRARIYFTASNLFTWHKYDFGWDPEVSSRGDDPVQQGFDRTTYPTARMYGVGISYDF